MKFLLESFSFLVKAANWKMISLDLNGILFLCDKATLNETPSRALMSRKRRLHVEYFRDQNSRNSLRTTRVVMLTACITHFHYYFPWNLRPLMFAVDKQRIIVEIYHENGSRRKGNGDERKFNQIWITLCRMTLPLFEIDNLISDISCRQISRDDSSRNIRYGP